MLKNTFSAIVVLVIMCSIIFGAWDGVFDRKTEVLAVEEMNVVDAVFKDSGCEWVQVNVNGWGMVNLSDVSMDKIESIGIEAADFFELKSYNLLKNENQFMRQVSLNGLDANGDIVNIIISNELGSEQNSEVYIVVDIVSKDQERLSRHMYEKQKKFFEEDLNVVPMISTTMMGTFDAKYDEDYMDNICRKSFESLEGEITQVMKENGVISMAGYSPYISESLRAGENLINFQVAMRYSPYWGKTYIWMGTPIITTEY